MKDGDELFDRVNKWDKYDEAARDLVNGRIKDILQSHKLTPSNVQDLRVDAHQLSVLAKWDLRLVTEGQDVVGNPVHLTEDQKKAVLERMKVYEARANALAGAADRLEMKIKRTDG